ncbi:glycosyltransferase [Ruminococcaceae bacterium OttesenSCG-928-D13]|nr:glycosyltransferase [Ruminococcaceae bacterium OttesenSCG-928-D13]
MAEVNLEKNYVSAVVYLGDEQGCAEPFLTALCEALAGRFATWELVFVNDLSTDGTAGEVREFIEKMDSPPPVTMVNMSVKQGLELGMNAGLDMAVGDFVWEFDTMKMPYPPEMILQAYDACIAGSDIVTVSPSKNRNLTAGLFYKLFNASSRSKYKLRTDVFRLLSRRAINRVHSISATMPYRKAAYAASGMKMENLVFEGKAASLPEQLRLSRAVDSLALYTDIAYRASAGISIVMLVLFVAAVVYTIVVNFIPSLQVAPGWTTTMLMLSGGFFGVFLILAIVLKYLALLVEMTFRKQAYLVESIEKLK